MADSYENYLWTFLNLEEKDQDKLQDLALEIKTYTGENYLKLKLKIALQSTNEKILSVLNLDNNDLLIKGTDSAELTLLKKKIVDKFLLKIDSFDDLFSAHLDLMKTKSDDNDQFVNELLSYMESHVIDKEQTRKKTLNILEGEPESSQENPYSKEHIVKKFKEIWNNNMRYT